MPSPHSLFTPSRVKTIRGAGRGEYSSVLQNVRRLLHHQPCADLSFRECKTKLMYDRSRKKFIVLTDYERRHKMDQWASSQSSEESQSRAGFPCWRCVFSIRRCCDSSLSCLQTLPCLHPPRATPPKTARRPPAKTNTSPLSKSRVSGPTRTVLIRRAHVLDLKHASRFNKSMPVLSGAQGVQHRRADMKRGRHFEQASPVFPGGSGALVRCVRVAVRKKKYQKAARTPRRVIHLFDLYGSWFVLSPKIRSGFGERSFTSSCGHPRCCSICGCGRTWAALPPAPRSRPACCTRYSIHTCARTFFRRKPARPRARRRGNFLPLPNAVGVRAYRGQAEDPAQAKQGKGLCRRMDASSYGRSI